MRYSRIEECEIVNGGGVGVSLYTQGCPIHCKGCFNPETWDFNGGERLTRVEESQIYRALSSDYITRFSVLGGEPLIDDNLFQLNYILCTVKSNWPDKKIWIYTGYTWEQLQERRKNLFPDKLFITLKYTDYLICGPYIEEEQSYTTLWRGSRNQEIIDVQKTLELKRKILAYED